MALRVPLAVIIPVVEVATAFFLHSATSILFRNPGAVRAKITYHPALQRICHDLHALSPSQYRAVRAETWHDGSSPQLKRCAERSDLKGVTVCGWFVTPHDRKWHFRRKFLDGSCEGKGILDGILTIRMSVCRRATDSG
jgi:hypothetical protein